MIGVIAIHLARRYLIDSLPQQLEQEMIRTSKRSRVVNHRICIAEDVGALIHLSYQEKACIGSDLCARKINAD